MKIITLKYPIRIMNDDNGIGKEIKEITLRRLKAKDLKLFPKNIRENSENGKINGQDILPILAIMSGLTEGEIDEIDLKDLNVIMEEVKDFL